MPASAPLVPVRPAPRNLKPSPGPLEIFADGLAIEIRRDDRVLYDSPLEGGGFELPVPRQRRHPSATANHLASYHLPRKLGLRFAPEASTPSRKSSEPHRPVFQIELKSRRSGKSGTR